MNINLLKAKSLNKDTAYGLFIIQAHYAYLGQWGIQIVFWLSWTIAPFLIIWPINQFFAIPNKIKRHNLKIYEELLNTK